MQRELQLLSRLISIPDFLISLSCVCILIDYYFLSYYCHKEKHNSLTSEIIFAKKLYFNEEWKMKNEKRGFGAHL